MQLDRNVTSFTDRHGRLRYRFRKAGQPTHYFKNLPGTPGYKAELAECRAGKRREVASRAAPGTIDALVSAFYRSTAFNNAGDDKRRSNRGIIEWFRKQHGAKRVDTLGFSHVEAILVAKSQKTTNERGRTVGGRAAAHALRKQLLRVFDLGVKLGWIERNPVALTDSVSVPKTGGFHSWTPEEIAQYRARHPLGTKPRLALEIFLWTMQRRGDAALFGPAQLKGKRVHFWSSKSKRWLWLPAAPQLLEAIGAMTIVGTTTFLVTEFGKPFSKAGLGNAMRQWCDQAGLPHCAAHGLRKAVATALADNRATQAQLKAAGGWRNDQEVAIYIEAANQAHLAAEAMNALSDVDLANRSSRLAKPSD